MSRTGTPRPSAMRWANVGSSGACRLLISREEPFEGCVTLRVVFVVIGRDLELQTLPVERRRREAVLDEGLFLLGYVVVIVAPADLLDVAELLKDEEETP